MRIISWREAVIKMDAVSGVIITEGSMLAVSIAAFPRDHETCDPAVDWIDEMEKWEEQFYDLKAFKRKSANWFDHLEDRIDCRYRTHCGDYCHRSKKGRRVGLRGKR